MHSALFLQDFIHYSFTTMRTINTANGTESLRLRDLSVDNLREFINSFDVVLCDCDGVIWFMLGPIPGAGEALQLLKNHGKQVKFVSNNSLRSDKEYMKRFKGYGISDIEENDIVHPAKTMVWHLNKYQPNCTVFPLIPSASIEILQQNNIETVPTDFDTYKLDGSEFVKLLQNYGPPKVDAVLADVCLYASYIHLTKALQYLKDENCKLILGAMDTVLPLGENLHVPGCTDFYDILIKHSKKTPIVLGKPSKMLAVFLKERFSITQPQRCLFIGDSLRQDIGFAKNAGFQTLFVLTGGDSKENMLNAIDEEKPDYYTESVADFIELLKVI